MTQNQLDRLARAFAPKEVVERLDKIETLKRELRNLNCEIHGETHEIMHKVVNAEFANATTPSERVTVIHRPLPPMPKLPSNPLLEAEPA